MKRPKHAVLLASLIFGAGLAASGLFSSAGFAESPQDKKNCFSEGSDDYKRREFYDTGLASCTRLIAQRKGASLAAAFASRGNWQEKKGNFDAALADLDRAVTIDPKNTFYYDYRADVWLDKGEIDKAISNYNQSIRIDPTYAAPYYSRGRAYEKQGDVARAIESYRAALVPPRTRKVAAEVRIQEWAQRNAEKRLKELESQSPK